MNKNIQKRILRGLNHIALLVFLIIQGSQIAWAQNVQEEKLLYSTDFTEWNDIDRKTTIGKKVTQWTEYSNEELTFTLNGVGVDPKSTKFAKYTGYMITAKYTGEYSKDKPSVITSKLKSITKIVLTQAATGGKRGIKVSVKGDGDNDWVPIHNTTISKKDGEELTLKDINRTNCQIKFENFTLDQNAYIVDLKIYGNATGSSNGIKMLTFEPQEGIIGKYPTKIKCNKDGNAVMPSGNTFSKPGYTFESWTDGTKDYEPGKTYTFTQDVTLKPKMRANSYHLYDNNQAATIVWSFDHTNAPALNIYSEHTQKDLSYTRSIIIHIDGNTTETQDVALNINTKSGKIENTDERMNALNGKGALVKNGTQFSLPAMYGMTVTVKASDKVDDKNENRRTSFGTGNDNVQIKLKDTANQDSLILKDAVVSEDGKTVTFTYKGDESTITLTPYVNQGSKADNWFFESITATYPQLANFSYTNTISNPDATNFPNEKVENACETKVTLEGDTKSAHANTGGHYVTGEKLTITPTPKYGYEYIGIKIGETTYTASPYDYTVHAGENNLEVIYTRKDLYKITLESSEAKLGTVSIEPKYDNFYSEQGKLGDITHIESWYTPETKVTVTAEAATNYIVDYWRDGEDRKDVGETYSFTTTDQDRTIIAHFKEGKMGNIIFNIDNVRVNGKDEKGKFQNAISIKPDDMLNVRSFTIPTNYTLFKSIDNDGTASEKEYTLKYWQDDRSKQYKLGYTYSFSTEGETITLVPVFEENSSTQDNRVNDPLIRYDFARKVKEYEDASTESSTDPSTKEARKVSAQTVNIGKNKQMFWTSKVWVKVRENSVDSEHWRDAALWCDTGKKGYIRNEQFDNWCAFGPGTTFWFPSGTGTKVSLMSYSKITTTTIDDSVPTLDRERTNIERKKVGLPSLEEEEKGAESYMYVYTHTTQSPDLRAAIKIGDDYSYYQWLEIKMLAANWVTLHAATNDDLRGIIKDIQLVTTDGNHELKKLEDGGLAFHKGERIRITLNRKKGYELDKILDLNTLDENGEPLILLEMNDDGTTKYSVFDLKKTENYQTGKDHYLTSDSIRTQYVLEGNITNHRNLQVCFKEMKNTYYITYNAGNQAEGTSPEATWVEAGDLFVVPKNKTLYLEGNTLHHWVDGAGNEYKIGEAYKAPEKFIRMFPVFEPNKFNILNLTKEATATWHFAKNDGAPTINYEGTKGILVTQLVADGKSIDLKITLDGSKGKFNNVSNTKNPERIQINSGSIVEFPSTPGCEAKWTATENGKKLTIAGKIVTLTNTEASVTCSGETVIQKVEFNQGDGAYSKSFSVTYKPQNDTKPTIKSLTCNGTTLNADQIQEMMNGTDKCITFTVSPWINDNNTIPEVTGTATENGSVTVTKATVLSPECVATVKTQSGIVVETYPIKFKFDTPTDAPTLNEMTVNGTTYTGNTIKLNDVPRSGVIKLNFNRPMKATNYQYGDVTSSTAIGKEQIIKYWDLPSEGTVTLKITPTGDIYGCAYGHEITLTLHVAKDDNRYHRHKFDFIVGKDGNMDEAIKTANENTKTDHRYYIFVPDGEYQLTGNTTISYNINVKDEELPTDENGKPRKDMDGKNNGKTEITKSNISLIGQSKEGVKIWNHPVVEGISYTATIQLNKKANDFYAQDLTLENQFNYWGAHDGSSGAGRAVAFWDQGNRSVLKNVALMSWQDTYYSSNANADYRGYFENCDLAGVVDWICGNGDIWFEKCNLIVRDRTGNNIAAPSTEDTQAWGYVFNNCTIRPETDKPTQLKGNDWTLARPWDNSPACTFLNTKMYTLPRSYGWNRMNAGKVVRFHEYNSVDDSDTQIPLETRSLAACSPAPGSDDCILTAAEATGYNIRNVMGGNDAFEPQELCKQIDAKSGLPSKKDEELEDREKVDTENHIIWDDNLVLDDDKLQWNDQKEALCYFLFKLDEYGKWKYLTNVTENYINLTTYGSGYYCVRAANQRGGLGAATDKIKFTLVDAYELVIKKTGDYKEGDKDYGWSTICLPFNAKVPEGVKAYAATAHNSNNETDIIKDYTMTLTEVNVINANKGYVVYGPVGSNYFHSTSRESNEATILKGNPTKDYISSDNNNGYVLSYKTWGLGFYKYTGSQLSPYRAWLPQNMVSKSNEEDLALGKQAIHLVFAKGTSGILPPTIQRDQEEEKLFNLSGQQVEKATKGLVISRKKGKFIKE